MTTSIAEIVKRAYSVSTPIVAIATADPAITQDAIVDGLGKMNGETPGALSWDTARGITALNDRGQASAVALGQDPSELTNPAAALILAAKLPPQTVLFFHFAHLYLDNEQVRQATWNLRDAFKVNGRMLIMLGPDFSILPGELAQDILVLEEPYPDQDQLKTIALRQYDNARESYPNLALPDDRITQRIVDCCTGIAAFPAEQAIAESLKKAGMDFDNLALRQKALINAVRGLRVEESKETFDLVGGLTEIKAYFGRRATGPRPVSLWLWIDEIEKLFAGSGIFGGDTSGVSQDQLATFLTLVQLYGWTATLAVGLPGTGKSLIAKTAAATHGGLCIAFDTGAAKGSLVGESERYIRAAFRTVRAIGGDRVHIIATCNGIDSLRPEMRRRFGTPWVFVLPTKAEREAIWPISLRRYGFTLDAPRPEDPGWTGAEINKCCETAYLLNIPLIDAAKYIIPICQSDPEAVEKLKNQAAGRWLSASYPGPYRKETEQVDTGKRKIVL